MRRAAPAQASWGRLPKRWGNRPGVCCWTSAAARATSRGPLAEAGFQVTLADFSAEMVRRAAAKLDGTFVVADGQQLPFCDAAFDCAISVNVLGHLPEWRRALKEARRVLRDGPLVLKVSTRETVTANWIMSYLPELLDYAPLHHYQPAAETVQALQDAGFSRVDQLTIHYEDADDGSFQALKAPSGAPFGRRADP